MVNLINHYNRDRHHRLLDSMHADRKRVFVDLLKWNVPHDEFFERDEFDDDHAVYLVITDPRTGAHQASVRLLRTDRRHILGDIFPELCDGVAPRGPDYREITRLCFAPGIRRAGRVACRNLLARSLVEYALLTGIKAYTGVAEMSWLSQILAAGWRCRPLGPPRLLGPSLIGSLIIEIDPSTLIRMHEDWKSETTTMRVVEFDMQLAA